MRTAQSVRAAGLLLVAALQALVGRVAAVTSVPVRCPSNWGAFQGRCYWYSGDGNRRTWFGANDICAASGGTLASIHNNAENQHADLLGCRDNLSGYSNRERGVCWIGLYQVQGQSGTAYQWNNGEPFNNTRFNRWAPGEPNNVGGIGEDCTQIWDRQKDQANWNDEPCQFTYEFVCTKNAECPRGRYLSRAYAPWISNAAQCTSCPGGTFNDQFGGIGLIACDQCPAGTQGDEDRATVCSEACPSGFYCPAGTDKSAAVNSAKGRQSCPVGTYGATPGLSSLTQCELCNPGFFCDGIGNTRPDPPTQLCAAGRCGFLAQSTSQCNQDCPAGFICAAGSACPGSLNNDGSTPGNGASQCGGNSVYCPAGSLAAVTVDPGFYSVGGTANTRTGQQACEQGYYCENGLRRACPGGTFSDQTGVTSAAGCSPCEAGYVCPAGQPSTSARAVNCYDVALLAALGGYGSVSGPEEVYCPAGSAAPLIVSPNHYSTPDTLSTLVNRRGQTACASDEVCVDGKRAPLLIWATSTSCGTSGAANLLVAEMRAAGNVQNYPAQVAPGASGSFVISYQLADLQYIDPAEALCAPSTPAKNQGVFRFNTQAFGLTRGDLNFEVCLPIVNVVYIATLQAQVRQSGTLLSTITCALTVEVDDANDKPAFVGFNFGNGNGAANTVYHRQIFEQSDKNVPVAVCDADGVAAGCPPSAQTGGSAPELLATDEDDGSVLTYSIVSGDDGFNGSPESRPFKIDPCTGLVSARFSRNSPDNTIRFNSKRNYTYQILVTDDGNAGRYTPRTDEATLVIHVMDVNDSPVMLPDPGTLTIAENLPEDSLVAGASLLSLATDEDGDTLTFQLVNNDGDAFKIVNNQLLTTRVGSETINFESSKKTYFLEIEVQDSRGGFATGTFAVTVTNSNDPPRFTGALVFYVRENLANRAVCADPEASCGAGGVAVGAVDEDAAPLNTITFALTGAGSALFNINANTGVIRTAGALDFEPQSIALSGGSGRGYLVEVTATSVGSGPQPAASATTSVVVYVVDVNEAPTFVVPVAPIEVPETWPVGAALPYTMEAVDPDNADDTLQGELAPKQTLSFSDVSNSQFFSVSTDPATGRGVFKVLRTLDFETTPTYTVRVRVEDNGGPTRQFVERDFVITVLDMNEAPAFAQTRIVVNVNENSGHTSADLKAVDADSSDVNSLSYEVVGGNGGVFFTIEPRPSGAFRVVKRATFVGTTTPATLDFELSSKEWSLEVRASDAGPSSRIGAFCSGAAAGSCGAGGAFCLADRCAEVCFDTNVRAAAVVQALVGPSTLFRCPYGGETVLGTIDGVATTPFVETALLTYVVAVQNVNDAPVISGCPRTFRIVFNRQQQNQQVTTPGQLASITSDPDAVNPDGLFINAPYTYSLQNNAGSPFLQIATSGGQQFIQYVGATGNGNIGIVGNSFAPTLRVTDAASAFSECVLSVVVSDENTPPVLQDFTTRTLFENEDNASPIVLLNDMSGITTDLDVNEVLTYSTSPNSFFVLDPNTGRLSVGSTVVSYEDFAPSHAYELVVRVTDSAGAEDVATITVPIGDANEAPRFAGNIAPVSVPENATVSTQVLGPLVAGGLVSDPDQFSVAAFRTLTFSLVSCTTGPTTGAACPFTVSSSTGAVTLSGALDFEGAANVYALRIRATDGGSPGLSDDTIIDVAVTDVNEPPQFVSGAALDVQVPEGDLDQNAALFNMQTVVTDPDAADDPSNLVYSIISGGAGRFRIEGGVLFGNNFVLDYEEVREYSLLVSATDTAGLSAQATVRVLVQNQNDVRVRAVSLGAASELDCDGGTLVTVTGDNLGLVLDGASPATFAVTYTSTRSGKQYVCANAQRVSTSSNSAITCTAGAGVGSGFNWRVSVTVPSSQITNNTSPAFATASISYEPPVITSILNATNLPTAGGATVTIQGTCLGSPSDYAGTGGFSSTPATFVEYCSATGGQCFRPDCVIGASGDLVCTTVPGVGAGLQWVVQAVGVQSGSSPAGSFAPPSVTGVSVTTFPSSGDLGPAGLVITGANFGPLGSSPGEAYAELVSTFNPLVTREYALQNCQVTTAYTVITCSGIAPGMGANLPLVLEFGGQASGLGSSVLVQYARPVVSSFVGEAVLDGSAAGGQQFVVSGSGFGPACGRAATDAVTDDGVQCNILRVTYSRGSRRASDNSLIVYTSQCVVVSNVQLVCTTAPGTGAGHVWDFDFGGHTGVRPPTGVTTSYAPPTVGAYEGPGSSDALTSGGQEVLIIGSNFGPSNGAAILAFYGPETNPLEFGGPSGTGIPCVMDIVNERVRCLTVVGAGDDLSWTLFVDGQESRTETTNYGEPEVYSFASAATTAVLNVDGGDVVTLLGLNFGPVGRQEYLESVTYGPASNPAAYAPVCEIVDHTELQCATPPGIGATMLWRVTVKGQTSAVSVIRASYTLAALTELGVANNGTQGGYLMRVYANGLAVCDPETTITVLLGAVALPVSQIYDDNVGAQPIADLAAYCDPLFGIARGRRSISFIVPELATVVRAPPVSLRLASTRFPDRYLTGTLPFEYAGPRLDSVFAEPQGAGSLLRVVLRGSNFCRNQQCCQVFLNSNQVPVDTHTHDVITFSAVTTGATVQVRCGARNSQVLFISTDSPFVYAASLPGGGSVQGTVFPTDVVPGTTIELLGFNFGAPTPVVSVGGRLATVTAHVEVDCVATGAPIRPTESRCWRTTIALPDGQGSRNGIVVVASGSGGAQSTPDAPFEFVAYAAPQIATVTVLDETTQQPAGSVPTRGGRLVRITGTNFGLNGEVQLYQRSPTGVAGFEFNPQLVGKLNCTGSPWTHTELLCVLPPGEGANLEVVVVAPDQNSGTDDPNTPHKISYDAPIVTSVTLADGGSLASAGSTSGGDLIRVTGANLGRPFEANAVFCPDLFQKTCTQVRPAVLIGGLTCVFVNNTHEDIFCRLPAGEGKDLAVTVDVRGQTATAPQGFSYAAPSISVFTPLVSRTSGNDGAGQRQLMRIFGDNFGLRALSVRFVSVDGTIDLLAVQRPPPAGVTFPRFQANHSYIQFEVPPYRGKDLRVVVQVAGQEGVAVDLFSYFAPSVSGVSILDPNQGGNVFTDVSAGATGVVATNFLPDTYTPGASSGLVGRRALQTGGGGSGNATLTTPSVVACEVASRFRTYSWRTTSHSVYNTGAFIKTSLIYDNEYCTGAPLVSLQILGGLSLAAPARPELGCAVPYKAEVEGVEMTPLSEEGATWLRSRSCCTDSSWSVNLAKPCACAALAANRALLLTGEAYGVYMVDDLADLYFSLPLASASAFAAQQAFKLPDTPTLVSPGERGIDGTPTGPTSGCLEFEPFSLFKERRDEAIFNTGTAVNVYRRCLRKALMSLTGDNFSTQLINASNANEIKIIFFNEDTGAEFRAATTSTAGDHNENCTAVEGCLHIHNQVIFQIPPGSGRNLLVRIEVGNQVTLAEVTDPNATDPFVRFNYAGPEVDRVSPGTLGGAEYEFADANGESTVSLRGDNFGGVATNTTILIDGIVCPAARWRSPDEDLVSGLPFLSCLPTRDAVGPRGLFVCVSNQATYVPVGAQDASLQLEADRIVTSSATGILTETEDTRVDALLSLSESRFNTRCKSVSERSGIVFGEYGGLGELCVACPVGSVCNRGDSPFSPPNAAIGFYRLDVRVFESDESTITERAGARCPPERWDVALLDGFPSAVLDDTCSDYVACQPSEACEGANTCGTGYRYAFDKCNEVRGAPGYDNACNVLLNPFTGAYEGVDSDCNPDPGAECAPDRPEDCARCQVIFDDGALEPRGECQCTQPQRCALCTLNSYFRLNNRCEECPNNPVVVLLMFILVVILAIVGGYYLNKKRFNLALIAIGVDYLQVLAIFASANIIWPPLIQRMFDFFSFFNFNIDIVGIECIVPTFEFETKWWLMESLPLVILAALMLVHLGYTTYKIFRWHKRTRLTSHVSRLVAIYLVIFYFLYLNVTKKALDIFNCNKLPEDDGFLYTSFTSLSCDGGSLCRCGDEGGVQERLVPLAWFFLIIYSFGFPAGIMYALHRNRKVIVEDQYLRAHGIGETRETNPRAYDTRKRFGQLYAHFKPEKQYWIVVIIARKFFIAFSALMFRTNTTFQLAMVLLVLFVSFVAQVQNRPYLSTGERPGVLKELDEKAEKGLDDPEFSKYTALQRQVQEAFKIHREMERRTKSRRLAGGVNALRFDEAGGKATKQYTRRMERQRRARLFFFDFNTLEAVLLGSAILVCVAGILLESGRANDAFQGERDVLGAMLFTVVLLSLIYYLAVILVELFPGWNYYARCLQRRRPDKHEIVNLDEDLQMDTNPVFSAGLATQADNSHLRSELEQSQAELDRIATQNEALRSELRRKKQDDQLAEEASAGLAPPPGLDRRSKMKKEFKALFSRSGNVDTSDP